MSINNVLGEVLGWTFELGARKSDSFTRIYHKYPKHLDKTIRVESEFKGFKCKSLFACLISKVEAFSNQLEINNITELEHFYHIIADLSQSEIDECENLFSFNHELADYIARVAIGQKTFIDRSQGYDNGYVKICPRLPFWENFVNRVGEQIKIATEVSRASLQKKHNWLAHQVGRFFCILEDGLGHEGLHKYIDNHVYSRRQGIDPQTGERIGGQLKYSNYEQFQVAIMKAKGIEAFYLPQEHEEELKKYWVETEGEFPPLFVNHPVVSFVRHQVDPMEKQKQDLLFAVDACFDEDLLFDYLNLAQKLGFDDLVNFINERLIELVE